MSDTCILVHSCEARRDCWGPFQYFWKKWCDPTIKPLMYISSEQGDAALEDGPWIGLPTGAGEWSNRLLAALNYLKDFHDRVFMMDEDFWLTEPFTEKLWDRICYEEYEADAVHWGPPSKFYKFMAGSNKYDPKSEYLASTEPTAWNIAFLAGLLIPGETVWKFEVAGTKRLWDRPFPPHIYFYEWTGYHNAMSATDASGKFRPEGAVLRDNTAKSMLTKYKSSIKLP